MSGRRAWCVLWLIAGPLANALAMTPNQPAPPAHGTADPPPADELIEFLGGDDVGDAAWWEFLKKNGKKAAPPASATPGSPPSRPGPPPSDVPAPPSPGSKP